MSVGIDEFLGLANQLVKYYTVYANFILFLTLYPIVHLAPYIAKGYKHVLNDYPYLFYGVLGVLLWFVYLSSGIHVVRPILRYYVLRLIRWYFMLITLPLWVWWLVPLRMYQKRKARLEAEANGIYPSELE